MSRSGSSDRGRDLDARERIFRHANAASGSGREVPALFLLTVVTFLLVASISLRQATDPGRATIVLENAVASTTEIDVLLGEHLTDMKRASQSGRSELVSLPGYPIDVYLDRDEAATLDEPAVRNLLLKRSASLVYDEGLKAFDRTGNQQLGILSVQGEMNLVIDRLTADTHRWTGWAVALLSLVAVALTVTVLVIAEGYDGFSNLGFAVAIGAGFGLLLCGLAWAGAGWIGSDDPFVADLRDILRTLLAIPLRNFLVVALGGGFVSAIGLAAGSVSRRAGLEGEDRPRGSPHAEDSGS